MNLANINFLLSMVRKIRYEDYVEELTSKGFQHSLLLTRSACNGSKEGIDCMAGDEIHQEW